MDLEDFLVSYPSQDQSRFQEKISAKKEFNELASRATEEVPERGQYFNHQILIRRFMEHYDRQMILHETGTGKSFLIGAVGEHFRKLRQMEEPRTNIKGVIIIVKGAVQKSDIKRMLLMDSTGGYYYNKSIDEATTESSRKNRISRALGEWYHVYTSGEIVSEVEKLGRDELISKFSDYLIIYDEAHGIRLKQASLTGTKVYHRKKGESRETMKKVEKYYKLMRLFHEPLRSKYMLLTATPMVDSVEEVFPLLNLILPEGQEVNGKDLIEMDLEDVEQLLRGMVSYVRSARTGVIKELVVRGGPDDEDPTYYELTMSNFQTEVYEKIFEEEFSSSERGQAFYVNIRNADQFVFPDGSYGGSYAGSRRGKKELFGFPKYVRRTEERKRLTKSGKKGGSKSKKGYHYQLTDQFKRLLGRDLDDLREYSAIFHHAIKSIRDHPGIHVFHSPFVEGSGLVLFGLLLEHYLGYQRLQIDQRIIKKNSQQYQDSFKKRKRYAVLTHYFNSGETASIIEAMNNPANLHGEYIKVFLFSDIGSEGISINNALYFGMLAPRWNPGTIHQAESRIYRATSHLDLQKDGQEIVVKQYNYAAIPNSDQADSIDLIMYKYSKEKDYEIRDFFRKMKQVAIDCQIHRNRNIPVPEQERDLYYYNEETGERRLFHEDEIRDCDYQECNYQCYDPGPATTDYSTYRIYYIKEITEKILPLVREYFTFNSHGGPLQIKNYLDARGKGDNVTEEEIEITLYNTMIYRVQLRDRLGFPVYLRNAGNLFFIFSSFPFGSSIRSDIALQNYSEHFLFFLPQTFAEFSQEMVGLTKEDETEQVEQSGDVREYLVKRVNNIYFLESITEEAIIRNLRSIQATGQSVTGNWGQIVRRAVEGNVYFVIDGYPSNLVENYRHRMPGEVQRFGSGAIIKNEPVIKLLPLQFKGTRWKWTADLSKDPRPVPRLKYLPGGQKNLSRARTEGEISLKGKIELPYLLDNENIKKVHILSLPAAYHPSRPADHFKLQGSSIKILVETHNQDEELRWVSLANPHLIAFQTIVQFLIKIKIKRMTLLNNSKVYGILGSRPDGEDQFHIAEESEGLVDGRKAKSGTVCKSAMVNKTLDNMPNNLVRQYHKRKSGDKCYNLQKVLQENNLILKRGITWQDQPSIGTRRTSGTRR